MLKPNHLFIGSMVVILAGLYLLNNYLTITATLAAQSETISKTDIAQDQENLFAINIAHAEYPSGNLNPTCFDNYQSWPSSTTFKSDAPWSTAYIINYFIGANGSRYNNNSLVNNLERDINGDGLVDYVYSYHTNSATGGTPQKNFTYTADCVYLSNGNGWEAAYKCVAVNPSGNTVNFYGDCAQT